MDLGSKFLFFKREFSSFLTNLVISGMEVMKKYKISVQYP